MTSHYRVIFDRDFIEWIPPLGVLGGVMGDIGTGQLAVYQVPAASEQEFLEALAALPGVVEFEQMTKEKSQ